MIEDAEDFRRCLFILDPEHPGFPRHCDDLLDSLSRDVAENAYVHIFEFFRRYPESDMGAPGSLVHFVEQYYPDYMPALLHDARVYPSYNSILMVNRILNSEIPNQERSDLMDILRSTKNRDDIPDRVNELAADLLEFQNDRTESAG
ncbi:hypothetical protein V22_36440 [Calycomorphotria hydatis]|uniref:Immunity protein 30 domain-containing protein n=1 Tax=Calycomorphotria hydatis TaxID=2528027 RepID=A0A517TDD3_9PLAN|nr:hypothetical protein V22_36440 [Calycomorphotria hydatis]